MALETLASYDLLDAPSSSSSGHAGPSTARTWTGSAASTALRRSVEKRLGAGSREFLGTFGQVNAVSTSHVFYLVFLLTGVATQDLDDLQSHLKAMHDCCDHVGERLHAAHADAQPLLQQADSLKKQRCAIYVMSVYTHADDDDDDDRADIGIQQQVISAFLARFTLSPEQLQTLSSPNSTIGPPLFDVIDHLHQIREHCQLLLAAAAQDESPASHRPNAGLEIMSSTSKQLDVAYTKLQKFAAFQVRGYTRPEVEVSPVMRQVVQHLKARPQALDAVLDTLTTNRSSALLSHFVDALTRGGPNGIPRPIELHAHDPIRYVGDMLAWIHQLMAAEREFLDSFFSVQASSRFPGAPRQDFVHERSSSVSDETVSDESRIRQLMDKDLEGCGRPLKLRVGQTVKSQEGSLMAYRISNLVLFYKHTIERTVGVEALMSRVLSDIATQATGAFYEILDAAARSYMRFVQPPPSDLSSPAMFVDALSNLKEVMDVYQATLMDSKQPEGGSTTEDIDAFEPVLHKALDPALKMCDQMAELTPRTWDRNVFLLNCRADAKTTLDPYEEFTAQRSDALQMEMNEKGEALASEHVGFTRLRALTIRLTLDDSTSLC